MPFYLAEKEEKEREGFSSFIGEAYAALLSDDRG